MSGRSGALALLALGALAVAGNDVSHSSAAFTAKKSNTATFTTKSDWLAPIVTLTAPAALVTTATPTLSGAAGALTGDGMTITVRVYAGSTTAGALVQTRTATRTGASYTAAGVTALADGTYTAQASQADAAGNTGTSAARTFTIDTTKPTGASIAAANGTGVAGRPDTGDAVTFSFSEAITATSILAGWDGTARAVQARFSNSTSAPALDTFVIRDNVGGTTVKLGTSVATYANVVTAQVDFTATMVRAPDGKSVTVTLGAATPAGSVRAGPSGPVNMHWTVSAGPLDLAGNAITTGTIVETDTDRDF